MKQGEQVDLENTSTFKSPEGNVLFQQGYIMRRVSKFIMQTNEDGFMPVPVFYDVITKKILSDTLPKELREEYSDYTF